MTVELSFSSRDTTTLTLGMTVASGAQSVDLQYSTRRDFQFAISPIINIGAAGPVGLAGLNRKQTYWIRGREVSSAGVRSNWGDARGFTTAIGDDTVPNYGIQVTAAVTVVPAKPSRWYSQAAGQVAGYPVANLGRATPMAAWRVYQVNGHAVFWIETDGSLIDTIALLETNVPEAATITISAGNTIDQVNGTSAALYSTAAAPFRASANLPGRRGYHGLVRLPAAIDYRFIRVDIAGAFPPGGLVQITHAVFGRARTAKNYSDMTDAPYDLGTFERLRDGSPDAVIGFRGRKVDFEVALMTEAQHEIAFGDIGMLVGTNEPVLLIPNSKAGFFLHDRLLYGNLSANKQTNSNARFTRSLSIDSIIN